MRSPEIFFCVWMLILLGSGLAAQPTMEYNSPIPSHHNDNTIVNDGDRPDGGAEGDLNRMGDEPETIPFTGFDYMLVTSAFAGGLYILGRSQHQAAKEKA